jgi:peptidoglycan/LPS O-acetylase OafA/YrhL
MITNAAGPRPRSVLDRFVRDPLLELTHPPEGRVPALDVLRSVAVLLVILVHTRGLYVERFGQESAVSSSPLVRYGWSGVDLFFVLSGFLIGKQLWRELAATQTIDVKRFILRRGFRIWPLYFSFCLLSVVLGRVELPFVRWWQDLTFTSNYFHDELVRGSWSLSTEEQFYVLTPLLLLAGARHLGSLRGYRKYLLGALVVLPILRALTWWTLAGSFTHHDSALWVARIYFPFHLHADTLVMGLLLSNLAASRDERGLRASQWILPLGAAACLPLVFVQREVFSFTEAALLFGACTCFAISPLAKSLPLVDARAFHVISRLSFGMYLNHRYFESTVLDFFVRHVPLANPGLRLVAIYVALAAVSAFAAAVTFCLVEHPFLALRGALLERPEPALSSGWAHAIDPARSSSEEGPHGVVHGHVRADER